MSRRLVVRALDGRIDRASVLRFIERRNEQIAEEAARRARDAPDP